MRPRKEQSRFESKVVSDTLTLARKQISGKDEREKEANFRAFLQRIREQTTAKHVMESLAKDPNQVGYLPSDRYAKLHDDQVYDRALDITTAFNKGFKEGWFEVQKREETKRKRKSTIS